MFQELRVTQYLFSQKSQFNGTHRKLDIVLGTATTCMKSKPLGMYEISVTFNNFLFGINKVWSRLFGNNKIVVARQQLTSKRH